MRDEGKSGKLREKGEEGIRDESEVIKGKGGGWGRGEGVRRMWMQR